MNIQADTVETARARLKAHLEAGLELANSEEARAREIKEWWLNVSHAVRTMSWELTRKEDSGAPERPPVDIYGA